MDIASVKLVAEGNDIIVSVEINNNWVEVIRESDSGPISQIVVLSGSANDIRSVKCMKGLTCANHLSICR